MYILTILGIAVLAVADYQEWFFSANGSCPGLTYLCIQDSEAAACAYDSVTDKYYCCGGGKQNYCRVSSPKCLGANGGPSSTQQRCTSGDDEWCCLKDTEECTPRAKQINVCFGIGQDTIANISQDFLDETFSSLSSAAPSDSTYAFNPTSLAAAALVRSSSTTTVTSEQLPSSSPSTIPSATESNKTSHPPSSGTLAGIVVGCVIGTFAIVVSGYVVFRRCLRGKESGTGASHASKPSWEKPGKDENDHKVSEMHQPVVLAEAATGSELHELFDREQPSELPAR